MRTVHGVEGVAAMQSVAQSSFVFCVPCGARIPAYVPCLRVFASSSFSELVLRIFADCHKVSQEDIKPGVSFRKRNLAVRLRLPRTVEIETIADALEFLLRRVGFGNTPVLPRRTRLPRSRHRHDASSIGRKCRSSECSLLSNRS